MSSLRCWVVSDRTWAWDPHLAFFIVPPSLGTSAPFAFHLSRCSDITPLHFCPSETGYRLWRQGKGAPVVAERGQETTVYIPGGEDSAVRRGQWELEISALAAGLA